ncbi:hypothetical protein CLV84_1122 [Neolewinella xylanilytica]|uniref:Secreted protein (Por secretion system target) n=1 Tax=Neolewinella xylanilytica TaxID=1514080 RepID=A0A2S6I9H5_9BACT|nr:hypothetical protein [Neolewinella xylanilytica]PPK88157.1 hypothetical protein CLV84_1122 [Neolewinella xylanilytica]
MKHLFTLFFLCLSLSGFSQRVVTAPGSFRDLVYVEARDRLYALQVSDNNAGSALCLIDRESGAILESYPIGLDPTRVVATSSGDYLYVAFASENRVRRFSLLTNSIDLDFSLGGEESFDGPFFAEDILPIRGSDDLLAVARGSYYTYPSGAGIALFDRGLQLPNVPTERPAGNTLVYTDQDATILAFENQLYYQLQRLAVTTGGLDRTASYDGLYTNNSARLEYAAGQLYAPNGGIAQIAEGVPGFFSVLSLEGLNQSGNLAVEAAPEENRLYYLGSGTFSGRLSISVFDLPSQTYVSTIELDPYALSYNWQGGSVLEKLGESETFAYITDDRVLGIVTLCGSASAEVPPALTGSLTICIGDSLLLTPPSGSLIAGGQVIWSTGATGDSIYVTEADEYSYRLVDPSGCPGPPSPFVYVDQMYYGYEPPYIEEPQTQVLCSGSTVELTAYSPYGFPVVWNTGDTTSVLTVSQAGTYFAYGIIEDNGCLSSPSEAYAFTAVDAAPPAAPVVEQGLFIDTCTTDLVDLSIADGDLYYYWTADYNGYYQELEGSSRIGIYPNYASTPSPFTVQAMDDNGCLSPITTGQFISRPLPDAPTIQYNEATTTLASTLSGPLYWYHEDVFEGETTGRYYRPQRNGFYTARKKGPYCLSEPSNLVSVGGVSTAVYDEVLSEQVRIFPVPARESVNVSIGSGLVWTLAPGLMDYQLFNHAGALITTGKLDPRVPQTPISVAGLPAGMYVLTLATREGQLLRKRITVM